jgi:acyl-homoserine-lactone acylase
MIRLKPAFLQPELPVSHASACVWTLCRVRVCVTRQRICILLLGCFLSFPTGAICAHEWKQDDFRWMHGANYVASYAATDVEMWLHYDHVVIDRELGYARKLGLNCVRVFLQSLVYHHDPEAFLHNFEDFLTTADKHGLKVMPILFDSCFGVSPSLESRGIWVANPGPDRMDKKWWPESDAYARAVVSAHIGDKRIALWDVMNEPTATHLAQIPEGKELIDHFVAHYCALVRELDPTHAITVGVAKWDNQDVIDLVDVLSCHSYAVGVEAFRKDLVGTQKQALAAGKPWIVSECCNPAAGSTYEMAMPVLRELGVGYTVWQLIIGRDQFNAASGLVYPDGTVRRIAQIEAVMNAPAAGFQEKPDAEGLPIQHDLPVKVGEYLEQCTRDGVSEATWRERVTLVESHLALPAVALPEVNAAREAVAAARKKYEEGDHEEAFETVSDLIEKLAAPYRANPPRPRPRSALIATVYRDTYGIPHIFADSEETAAYAIAQVQCEDMGMQVFNNLRNGIGRKAEVFGERAYESDRIMQLWRVPQTSAQIWRDSSLRTRRLLQAFCDGLNDYRKNHPEECSTALEADPIQVIALFRWSDITPSHGIVQFKANTGAKVPPPKTDFPNQSSTWAFGPSRTASGRPILFIDPHWPAEGQSSWWEFHVHVGRTQAGGFALPGLPFVGLGYTDGVAWAGTAGGADSSDAFELRVNPENPDQYWYDGRWRDMEIREAVIRVKTAAGETEDRTIRIRESLHGPIILEQDGRVVAGAICGARDTTRLEQWLEMNRAQSAEELRNALRMDQASLLNLTYATRDGHFGYIQAGMCPRRGSGPYNMIGLTDGTRSETNWQGRIPFDELPQLHDPETGWLQSCNTAANYVTEGQTIRQEDFPPGALCGHYSPDGRIWRGRGRRCFEAMPRMRDVTLERARQFALETYAPAGPIWAKPLCAAYDKYHREIPDKDGGMKKIAEAVRNWDYHVRKESVGATAFRYWRMEYRNLHPEAFGENEAYGAPKTEEEQRDAVRALHAAADYLNDKFGAPLVPWGQLLRLRRGNLDLPLDGDVGFFGGVECMRATGTQEPGEDGRYVFNGGQVIPTVVELTDPIQAWSIVPYGQSRRPESPHYADQARLYSESQMRPAWHTWSQLRDHVSSVKVFEYRPQPQVVE